MISQLRTVANQLTLLRLIFIPFVIINVLDQNYGWALALFIGAGLSDALDGFLARWLKQQTLLGQYLDPIADKLLLSSLFLVLSFMHDVPWKYTVIVFSRDISILAISAVLYATTELRNFSPSIFGKMNTVSQVATVFFVLLGHVVHSEFVSGARRLGLWLTFTFTILSALHYIVLVNQRLRALPQKAVSSSH
ncbi:MAG TPA: CDP-alcohol phosphatidyltransferase family protein [Terriglobales bacterium]|nr:CDP-alcohol phosphatidyltransferase family protein [Terriglobales bacterium]